MRTPNQPKPSSEGATEQIAVPVSLRLPAKQAYLLYLIAEQMNSSPGKVLSSMLDEVLPAFEHEGHIDLKISKMYRYMKEQDFLRAVNERDLEDRLLKRTEAGGTVGRPPKARSIRSVE